MAGILVRDLEDDVKERLQRRARLHGRSMEAEVRSILRDAVLATPAGEPPLGQRWARRFTGVGLVGPLEELRGQPARPAPFPKADDG